MSINNKLDEILRNQKKIIDFNKKLLKEEDEVLNTEKEIKEGEQKLEKGEQKEENLLQELEELDKSVSNQLNQSLRKVTIRDGFKSFIGAFIGLVSHFVFLEALHLSESITFYRATIWYIFSFLLIIVFVYYTGFRKVKRNLMFHFLPARALMIYFVSIGTSLLVYVIFGIYQDLHMIEIYKAVGSSLIPAVIGASTADLLGKSE